MTTEAEGWELLNVTTEYMGSIPCYRVELMRPNGVGIPHIIPQKAFELRAAEYGLDYSTPEGKAKVWDIILHEAHFTTDPDTEPHLSNASTIEEAAAHHLDQVEKVKSDKVNILWSGNPRAQGKSRLKALTASKDPAKLLLDHEPDPKIIAEHKERIFQYRASKGLEKAPPETIASPPKEHYDKSVRRRGLTVTLLDT